MQSLTRTATLLGTDAQLVTVECTTTSGFAGLQLVGNIGELCRDGKERAKTVLENLGFKLGHKRILINFSPADSRKEGNHFDLPIAISLAGLVYPKAPVHDTREWLFAAELGLDGCLRPSQAAVPLMLAAMQGGLKGAILAADNTAEIEALMRVTQRHAQDFQYHCFERLEDVLQFIFEDVRPSSLTRSQREEPEPQCKSFQDMYLSYDMKRVAVCAAVGRHSLLLRGTPGSGKSMFASRLPSLLPTLDAAMHLDILKIHSLVSKRIPDAILQGVPPFRQPHHTTNPHAILGTGDQPGELSLAHGGILFLDELPEYRRDLLESLREPLETGLVHISRAQIKLSWKTQVQFIAACNNCPCGYHGSKKQLCVCTMQKIMAYRARMSGPLLERIDIHFTMPEIKASQLGEIPQRQLEDLTAAVLETRNFMHKRWRRTYENANASLEEILSSSRLFGEARSLLLDRLEDYRISSRSMLRVLRVARTLADIEGSETLSWRVIEEANAWRPRLHD